MYDLKHLMFMSILLPTVWSCELLNPENLNTTETSPDADCRYNTTYTWDKQAQKNEKDQPTISLSCLDHVDLNTCGQTDITTASWTFNDKPISAASDPRYVFNMAKGELSISNFNKRYAGEYRVTYGFGSQEIKCQICVLSSPLVITRTGKSEVDSYFLTGQDAEVSQNFEILGYPVSLVQWTKDGEPIIASGRIELRENNRRLIIKDAERLDSGNYSCTALSSLGQSSKSQLIFFKFKYEWIYPLGGIGLELVLFFMVFLCNSVRRKNKLRRKELRQKMRLDKYWEEQRILAEERESSSKDGCQTASENDQSDKSGGNKSELRSRDNSKTISLSKLLRRNEGSPMPSTESHRNSNTGRVGSFQH